MPKGLRLPQALRFLRPESPLPCRCQNSQGNCRIKAKPRGSELNGPPAFSPRSRLTYHDTQKADEIIILHAIRSHRQTQSGRTNMDIQRQYPSSDSKMASQRLTLRRNLIHAVLGAVLCAVTAPAQAQRCDPRPPQSRSRGMTCAGQPPRAIWPRPRTSPTAHDAARPVGRRGDPLRLRAGASEIRGRFRSGAPCPRRGIAPRAARRHHRRSSHVRRCDAGVAQLRQALVLPAGQSR